MHKRSLKMSIVVLNYNDSDTTCTYVKSLKDYGVIEHIIIVDNCSTDNSYEVLKKIEERNIEVIKSPRNGGYGFGNNYGIEYAKKKYNCKYIAVSNPDVVVSEDTIKSLLDVFCQYDDAGIVVPVMTNIHGKRNYKCVWKVPSFWQYLLFSFKLLHMLTTSMYYPKDYFFNKEVVSVGCVAGSFLILDMDAFFAAGAYDENIFLYCEETSLGIRMQKTGYKTYLLTSKEFIHAHSVSIKKSIQSNVKLTKMMWDSRSYILTHYWKTNYPKKLIVKVLKTVGIFEAYVYYFGK